MIQSILSASFKLVIWYPHGVQHHSNIWLIQYLLSIKYWVLVWTYFEGKEDQSEEPGSRHNVQLIWSSLWDRRPLARKLQDSLECHLLANIWRTLLQSFVVLFFWDSLCYADLGYCQTHVPLASARITGFVIITLGSKNHFLK